MKKYCLFSALLTSAMVILLMASCEKKYIIDVAQTCSNCAMVKFLNGNPDPAVSYQFFINNNKITGNALNFSGIFPGTIEYAAVPSG